MNESLPDPPAARPPLPQRALEWLRRHRYVLAPVSFAAGLASFLLIERQERLVQWLAVLVVLVWILALAEGVLGRWMQRVRWLRLSPVLVRIGTQATHQEAFFFTLPFFLHTTDWTTGQGVFTGLAIAAAGASMWDPFYFGYLAARPWLYLLFHALAVFVVFLTVGPILLHITTGESVALAAAAIAVVSVPSLAQVLDRQRWFHWILMPCAAAALGGLAWLARPWVPPATLWVEQAVITRQVFAAERRPGAALDVITPEQAHAGGLYAFTAIRAPRGLQEQVAHRWIRDGREIDRIPLDIVGGRAEGYRAWSHKLGFPADPRGDWTVQVVTEGGQLIGQIHFDIAGDAPEMSAPGRTEAFEYDEAAGGAPDSRPIPQPTDE